MIIGGLLGGSASYHAIQEAWLAVVLNGLVLLFFCLYVLVDHWRVMGLIRQRYD
jgi:hypothetical protein